MSQKKWGSADAYKITYISAQKTYSLGTLYPYSEYKYAINYEHHNEDSIKLSYLDKSDKKINHEVAPYVAKYDKKNYGITIK